jgi:hypothetical protein
MMNPEVTLDASAPGNKLGASDGYQLCFRSSFG